MTISSMLPNMLWLAVASALACGCATGSNASGKGARGFLRLEIEPPSVEVDIDEKYSGVANGWVDGVIPVQPGLRRVTLRAPGYVTQRFDIEVGAYEEVTLVLALEPALELPDEELGDDGADPSSPARLPFRAAR